MKQVRARAVIRPGKTGVMLLAALSLAGCATAGGGTAGDPPEAREVEPQVDPEPPDLSLEERWEEPFAVLSSGRPATRRQGASGRAADRGDAPAASSSTAARSRAGNESGDPADTLRTHLVEWGETWFGIARRYGVARTDLAAANPAVDPEQLRAGEVLLVPASGTGVDDGDVLTHTVVAGDSLWGIARRYDVEMDAIREANGLDGDRVRIGQTLIIPIR